MQLVRTRDVSHVPAGQRCMCEIGSGLMPAHCPVLYLFVHSRVSVKMSGSASARALAQWAQVAARGFASAGDVPARKVAVLGAAGGIGQPLSLLLKVRLGTAEGLIQRASHAGDPLSFMSTVGALCSQLNPQVTSLSLYDIAGTPGVAADVSHCNTKAQVKVGISWRALRRSEAHRPSQTRRASQWTMVGNGDAGLQPGEPGGGCPRVRLGDHPRWRAPQARHDP